MTQPAAVEQLHIDAALAVAHERKWYFTHRRCAIMPPHHGKYRRAHDCMRTIGGLPLHLSIKRVHISRLLPPADVGT